MKYLKIKVPHRSRNKASVPPLSTKEVVVVVVVSVINSKKPPPQLSI
jgi:hypothetical protein